MNIAQALGEATDSFTRVQIPQARREAEVVVTRVLGKDRSFLFAFPETQLQALQIEAIRLAVRRRLDGEPLAYIFGQKEFWSLELTVNDQVLIPRADTECIVQAILDLPLPNKSRVVDLGTGSGAIALALATERPTWDVYASDLHLDSLQVAQQNVTKYSTDLGETASTKGNRRVSLFQGNWLDAVAQNVFDLVVSNPPYIAKDDSEVASLTLAEPSRALFSEEDGLKDMSEIILSAPNCLKDGGWLVLEHGARQQAAVLNLFEQSEYRPLKTVRRAELGVYSYAEVNAISDLSGLDRGVAARIVKQNHRNA